MALIQVTSHAAALWVYITHLEFQSQHSSIMCHSTLSYQEIWETLLCEDPDSGCQVRNINQANRQGLTEQSQSSSEETSQCFNSPRNDSIVNSALKWTYRNFKLLIYFTVQSSEKLTEPQGILQLLLMHWSKAFLHILPLNILWMQSISIS